LSAGTLPQTPLGELTALTQPPSWIKGWGPWGKGRREGKGKGGREERGGIPECSNPELASLQQCQNYNNINAK